MWQSFFTGFGFLFFKIPLSEERGIILRTLIKELLCSYVFLCFMGIQQMNDALLFGCWAKSPHQKGLCHQTTRVYTHIRMFCD